MRAQPKPTEPVPARRPGAEISGEELALLNTSVGYLLRRTHLVYMKVLRERLQRYGITTAQWYFLRALWIEDGLTQRELSERASTTGATTTTALRLMERDGLVTRLNSPEDRRTITVHLTEKARALREEVLPLSQEANALALKGVPADDVALMRDILARMRRNLWAEIGASSASAETTSEGDAS